MRGRRRKILEDDGKTLASQIPGLSMFVIMLAFFVLLNSVSSVDTNKVKPMRESIESAFATKISAPDNWQPSGVQDEEVAAGEGRMTQRIEAMFTAQIAGIETQTDESSGTLLMRLKYTDFAKAVSGTDGTSEASQQFMRTLVSMMRSDMGGHPYRMDAFLQVTDNPAEMQSEQPQKMNVLMRDLSVLAQQVEKAGLPQKLMTIGLEQGQDGMIELLFRPHIPYNPLGAQAGE